MTDSATRPPHKAQRCNKCNSLQSVSRLQVMCSILTSTGTRQPCSARMPPSPLHTRRRNVGICMYEPHTRGMHVSGHILQVKGCVAGQAGCLSLRCPLGHLSLSCYDIHACRQRKRVFECLMTSSILTRYKLIAVRAPLSGPPCMGEVLR